MLTNYTNSVLHFSTRTFISVSIQIGPIDTFFKIKSTSVYGSSDQFYENTFKTDVFLILVVDCWYWFCKVIYNLGVFNCWNFISKQINQYIYIYIYVSFAHCALLNVYYISASFSVKILIVMPLSMNFQWLKLVRLYPLLFSASRIPRKSKMQLSQFKDRYCKVHVAYAASLNSRINILILTDL